MAELSGAEILSRGQTNSPIYNSGFRTLNHAIVSCKWQQPLVLWEDLLEAPVHTRFAAAQVQGLQPHQPGATPPAQIRSTLQGLRLIVSQQGPRALFAGLSLNYMKVVPSTAIGFTIYDTLKRYLGLPQHL